MAVNDNIASFTAERKLGNKFFELSNHLGNVLTTVSDRKLGVEGTTTGIVDYYTADVQSSQDYYPFGMLMPGRGSGAENYRFGFNGMEMDDEVKNVTGSSYTTHFRQYDSRLGRWLSLDPEARRFPWQSPFVGLDNNPIRLIDPFGNSTGGPHKPLEDLIKLADPNLLVDMDGAKGSSFSYRGAVKNAKYYWETLLELHPEYFNKDNADRILRQGKYKGKSFSSPRVNKTWTKYFPSHEKYMNEVLEHHHWNNGNMAIALPKSVHKRFSKLLHGLEQAMKKLNTPKVNSKSGTIYKKFLKKTGKTGPKLLKKAAGPLAIVLVAYNIYTTDDKVDASLREGFSWGGAALGAGIGGRNGNIYGALLGGIIGGFLGEEYYELLKSGSETEKWMYENTNYIHDFGIPNY